MKKTYMIPMMELLNVEEEQALLAGSVDGFASSLNETGTDGSNALAPEFDIYE